ncbi:MAG: hypothetical protein LBT04_02060 [Prevotellaceae bacterium]|jgi:uncharacterized membrane protein|nr:hypothetical protein [Prevotellaceae bacterium]
MSNEISLAVSVLIASLMLIALGVVLLVVKKNKEKKKPVRKINITFSLH